MEWLVFAVTHGVSSLSMLNSDFFSEEDIELQLRLFFSLHNCVCRNARTPLSETLNFAENVNIRQISNTQLQCKPRIIAVALYCHCLHELHNYSYSIVLQSMASFSLQRLLQGSFYFLLNSWTEQRRILVVNLEFSYRVWIIFLLVTLFFSIRKKAYANRWMTGHNYWKQRVWYAEFLKHSDKEVWITLVDSADSNSAE